MLESNAVHADSVHSLRQKERAGKRGRERRKINWLKLFWHMLNGVMREPGCARHSNGTEWMTEYEYANALTRTHQQPHHSWLGIWVWCDFENENKSIKEKTEKRKWILLKRLREMVLLLSVSLRICVFSCSSRWNEFVASSYECWWCGVWRMANGAQYVNASSQMDGNWQSSR